MVRKAPVKHRVKTHAREGKKVNSYVRGSGTNSVKLAKPTLGKISKGMSKQDVLTMMRQRAIEQGAVTSDEKGYNGWTNWDTWNTMLILDNTMESNRWIDEWVKNFNRKIKSGKFDPVQAEKVVEKYLVPAARGKAISKRFGSRFVGDDRIDPKQVNKAEIIHNILDREYD